MINKESRWRKENRIIMLTGELRSWTQDHGWLEALLGIMPEKSQ